MLDIGLKFRQLLGVNRAFLSQLSNKNFLEFKQPAMKRAFIPINVKKTVVYTNSNGDMQCVNGKIIKGDITYHHIA